MKDLISIIGPRGLPSDFPGTSGIETYTEKLVHQLKMSGHSVFCYSRNWTVKNNVPYKDARIISIPTLNSKYFDTFFYSLLASVHASISKSGCVWYQGIGPAFFAPIPKLADKKVYVTIHSLDWKRSKWGILAKIFLRLSERVAIESADRLFVVSLSLKQFYSQKYHKQPVLMRYPIHKLRPVSPLLIKNKYGFNGGYVLYMGRFVPEKRLEWLIKAFNMIPDKTLVMAGGSSHSDAYVSRLKKVATSSRIKFVGYVFGREKAELISNCDLFVSPSELEGYPVIVAETLSYGKPCLVGDFLKKEYGNNKLIHYFRAADYQNFLDSLSKLVKKS